MYCRHSTDHHHLSCSRKELIASIEMAQLTKGTVDALKTGVARAPRAPSGRRLMAMVMFRSRIDIFAMVDI